MQLPISTSTISLEQLVEMRVYGAAVERPLLAPGARWVRNLVPALDRAQHNAAAFASIFVRINVVYPGNVDPETPPDLSQSDWVDEFQEYFLSAFSGSPWQELLSVPEIREEWRPHVETQMTVAIYGRRHEVSAP